MFLDAQAALADGESERGGHRSVCSRWGEREGGREGVSGPDLRGPAQPLPPVTRLGTAPSLHQSDGPGEVALQSAAVSGWLNHCPSQNSLTAAQGLRSAHRRLLIDSQVIFNYFILYVVKKKKPKTLHF